MKSDHAQRATRAAHVLDHDRRVAQRLAQRLGQVARDLVGRAAGREGHDDGDRLVRVGEGRGRGEGGQHGRHQALHGSSFREGGFGMARLWAVRRVTP